MPPLNGHLVLTVNPRDRDSAQLSSLVHTLQVPVYISRVAGFGQPELRIGPGQYVRGVPAISSVIKRTPSAK